MKPETIVPSLELCKKLKEAGWRQSSNGIGNIGSQTFVEDILRGDGGLFGSYFKWNQKPMWEVYLGTMWDNYANIAEAPTAEEILRRLPKQTADDNYLTISPEESGWAVYYETSNNLPRHICKADTLANAAAAMYVYLSENKLLPPL
jgi:hypothetical protein